MEDESKTKAQLINELIDARQLIAKLEYSAIERKRVEKTLQGREAALRAITMSARDAIIMINSQGKISFWNPAAEQILGYNETEALGRDLHLLLAPERYHEAFNEKSQHFFNTGKGKVVGKTLELHAVRKDGTEIPVELSLSAVQLGEHWYAIGIIRDITSRKLAEEETLKHRHLMHKIFEILPVGLWIADKDGILLSANPKGLEIWGAAPTVGQEKYGIFRARRLPSGDEIAPDDWSLAHTVNEGITIVDELLEIDTFDGQKKIILNYTAPVLDDIGNIQAAIVVNHDITKLKQTEESLQKSEAKYRFLTDKMNDMIWTANLDFNLTYISPSVNKITGFTPEERILQSPTEMMTPESYAVALDVLSKELKREQEGEVDPDRSIKMELDFCHKNGSKVRMESVMSAIRDDEGKLVGIHGVSRDITERKRAEEEKKRLEAQLAQAQKLESIGTLAGGIAHDFNNILAAIIGYTELALDHESDPMDARSELKEVLKAGNRARDLVRQILAFSRQTETKHSPLALQTVIKETIKMMRSVIPTTIEIRQNLIDSGIVMSNPTQIHQIMMNLCTNAVHAMDKTGGVLDVSLKRVVLNGDDAIHDLRPGPYLRLSVSDNGHGIIPEVTARIFDPFFTTKEVGQGTGLGLSVVHGIVKSHGGGIRCKSKPGEGTIFDVYLPEIDAGEETLRPHKKEPLAKGTERILFVDDEPALIDLTKKMLENLGYIVTTRASSIEALELFRNNPDKFDLVITDMTMPAMTGDQLAQKIMDIRHDIPIILCTGYSEHITEERAKRIGIREFVMKPLVVRQLAITIRNTLDAG